MERDQLVQFFSDLSDREKYLGEIRAEIKESFDAFASSTGIDTKALKSGFKFFKDMNKDKQTAESVEFLRDKIIETLISGTELQG